MAGLGGHQLRRVVADRAHPRPDRPADSRASRAGGATVGRGGHPDGVHPGSQQAERRQRAARSDAGTGSIRFPEGSVERLVAA